MNYIGKWIFHSIGEFGEAADTWVKATDEDGYFNFMTMRFVKG